MNSYVISFKKDNVYQGRLIKAKTIEIAEDYFRTVEPKAEFIGISKDTVNYEKRGMPIDIVPEEWTGYDIDER